tara:strand:+ start:342 stop:467 length:126 start_codon:yes stop_codon:yes gene_type:complete
VQRKRYAQDWAEEDRFINLAKKATGEQRFTTSMLEKEFKSI